MTTVGNVRENIEGLARAFDEAAASHTLGGASSEQAPASSTSHSIDNAMLGQRARSAENDYGFGAAHPTPRSITPPSAPSRRWFFFGGDKIVIKRNVMGNIVSIDGYGLDEWRIHVSFDIANPYADAAVKSLKQNSPEETLQLTNNLSGEQIVAMIRKGILPRNLDPEVVKEFEKNRKRVAKEDQATRETAKNPLDATSSLYGANYGQASMSMLLSGMMLGCGVSFMAWIPWLFMPHFFFPALFLM